MPQRRQFKVFTFYKIVNATIQINNLTLAQVSDLCEIIVKVFRLSKLYKV